MSAKTKNKNYWGSDFVFLVKCALYLLLGTVWIAWGGHRWLPVGVVAGFFLSKIEFLRIDRKIEFALLVVGALLGLFGLGITIGL
jgi:hypothetical protein